MAVSPIATAIDGGGRPVYYSIAVDGSLMVNQSVPSNNPNAPPQPTAAQTLFGLKANSIAAFTDAIGETAVVATTASSSYVYVDRYAATGNSSTPFAWTGWQQLANFVASSVVAASDGASGGAVFAIGADSHVYEDAYAPTSGSSASQWSGFQPVGGTSATTISVVADTANTYEVAALTGPNSYVEATKAVDTGGTITSTPFGQLGNFVASAINLSPGLNRTTGDASLGDRLFLFAVGAGGALYNDPLTVDASTGQRVSTTYSQLGDPTRIKGAVTQSVAVVSNVTTSITVMVLVGSTGQLYEDTFDATPSSSTLEESLNSAWTLTNDGAPAGANNSPTEFHATSLAGLGTAPDFLSAVPYIRLPEFVSNDLSNVARAIITSSMQYYFTWAGLPTPGVRQIVAGIVNGTPAVVELANDGTVYVNLNVDALTYGPNGATSTPSSSFGTGIVNQFEGFKPLPGLRATSISVANSASGDMTVLALTGTQSYVYAYTFHLVANNQRPSDIGWSQVGNIVATSIQGASNNNGFGKTVFALGVNNVLYAASSTPQTVDIASGVPNFTPLPGLSVASFSVHTVGQQILVAALTGPQSYAYADLYTPPTDSKTPSKAMGWTQAGKAKLQSVVASESTTGAPIVAGIENSSSFAVSLSTDVANAPIGDSDNEQRSPGNFADNNLAALIYPSLGSVVYVSRSPSNTVILQAFVPGGSGTNGPSGSQFDPVIGTLQPPVSPGSIAVVSDGKSPFIFVGGVDGLVYVVQGIPTGNPKNPYVFATFASLGGPLLG